MITNTSTYPDIIKEIIAVKTGEADAWKRVSQHSIQEAVDALEHAVNVARGTTETIPEN